MVSDCSISDSWSTIAASDHNDFVNFYFFLSEDFKFGKKAPIPDAKFSFNLKRHFERSETDWLVECSPKYSRRLCLFTQSNRTLALLLHNQTLSINQRWEKILEMQRSADDVVKRTFFYKKYLIRSRFTWKCSSKEIYPTRSVGARWAPNSRPPARTLGPTRTPIKKTKPGGCPRGGFGKRPDFLGVIHILRNHFWAPRV